MTAIDTAYSALVSQWQSLSAEKRTQLLEEFSITYAYNSGKIENNLITFHDTQEIYEHGRVVSFTGDVRTLFEISNLKESWEWLLANATTNIQLSENLLLSAHELLCRGTYDESRWEKGERPGTYKINDYAIGIDQSVGYTPENVSSAICELMTETNEAVAANKNTLTIACYFHAMLAEIHPFADGNGRVARLFSNLILVSAGLPPVSIHIDDRMAYYGALDAFHDEGKLKPFEEFYKAECLKCWSKLAN